MKCIAISNEWRDGNNKGLKLPFVSREGDESISADLPLSRKSILSIESSGGIIDVFLGGSCIDSLYSFGRKEIELPEFAMMKKLRLGFSKPGTAALSVKLFQSDSDIYISPYGLYAFGKTLDSGAAVTASLDIVNSGLKRKVYVEFTILNNRGKRVTSRTKRFTVPAGGITVSMPINLRKANIYSADNKYIYGIAARIIEAPKAETALDETTSTFALKTDGKKFSGINISQQNGILGNLSTGEIETYKFEALKNLGYDAVRINGCPTSAALDAMDKLGIGCTVKIFDNWTEPKKGTKGHIAFRHMRDEIIKNSVKMLRSHPCVMMYEVGDSIPETYGRGSESLADEVISAVKKLDKGHPVSVSINDLELAKDRPELKILSKESNIQAIDEKIEQIARQAEILKNLTIGFASRVDGIGLYGYGFEDVYAGKPVYYSTVPAGEANDFDLQSDLESNVVGQFAERGIDEMTAGGVLHGDLDGTFEPGIVGKYRSVIRGNAKPFITVCEVGDDPLMRDLGWNMGGPLRTVNVNVFALADVVALHLEGKLISRRLASRKNDYIASFEVEYQPGKLEAVCYYKGEVVDTCELTTAHQPRAISLKGAKTVAPNSLTFIKAKLVDKLGNEVRYTERDLMVEVENGEVVMLANSNFPSPHTDVCTTEQGHAFIVVRAKGEGKLIVTVSGEKLKRAKLTITIK